MRNDQKVYGYYPVARRESDMLRILDDTNKNLGRVGFCITLIGVGGYILYRKVKDLSGKVNDLSRECKKMKEEMEK